MKRFLCIVIVFVALLFFTFIPAIADSASAVLKVEGDTGNVGDILHISYTIYGPKDLYSWQCIFFYDSDIVVPFSLKYCVEIPNGDSAEYALVSSVFDDKYIDSSGRDYKYYGVTGAAMGIDKKNSWYAVYATRAGSEADKNVPADTDGNGYTVFNATFKRISTGHPDFSMDERENKSFVTLDYSNEDPVNIYPITTIDYDCRFIYFSVDTLPSFEEWNAYFLVNSTEAMSEASQEVVLSYIDSYYDYALEKEFLFNSIYDGYKDNAIFNGATNVWVTLDGSRSIFDLDKFYDLILVSIIQGDYLEDNLKVEHEVNIDSNLYKLSERVLKALGKSFIKDTIIHNSEMIDKLSEIPVHELRPTVVDKCWRDFTNAMEAGHKIELVEKIMDGVKTAEDVVNTIVVINEITETSKTTCELLQNISDNSTNALLKNSISSIVETYQQYTTADTVYEKLKLYTLGSGATLLNTISEKVLKECFNVVLAKLGLVGLDTVIKIGTSASNWLFSVGDASTAYLTLKATNEVDAAMRAAMHSLKYSEARHINEAYRLFYANVLFGTKTAEKFLQVHRDGFLNLNPEYEKYGAESFIEAYNGIKIGYFDNIKLSLSFYNFYAKTHFVDFNIDDSDIEVKPILQRIDITAPQKQEYILGETLDLTGFKAEAIYSDNSTEDITKLCSFFGFNNQKIGKQTVKVFYDGVYATFDIRMNSCDGTDIIDNSIDCLKLGINSSLIYHLNDKFDPDDIVVIVCYKNGNEVAVVDYEVSGFDTSSLGRKTVTITYAAKSTSYSITVEETSIQSLKIIPYKSVYYVGEALDLNLLQIIAVYKNGMEGITSSKNISLNMNTILNVGANKFTATLNGTSISADFSVYAYNKDNGVLFVDSPIDSYNKFLTFDEMALSDTIYVNIYNASPKKYTGNLILAYYKNNELVKCNIKEVVSEGEVTKVSIDNLKENNYNKVKIFLWDSLQTGCPLSSYNMLSAENCTVMR